MILKVIPCIYYLTNIIIGFRFRIQKKGRPGERARCDPSLLVSKREDDFLLSTCTR